MKQLSRPTLARRVLTALLIAFAAVWLVLLAFQYLEVRIRDSDNPALSEAAAQLADMLSSIDDPAEARRMVEAVDRSIRNARERLHVPGAALIQLWERGESQPAFSSWPQAGIRLPPIAGHQISQVDRGQVYEVVRFDRARWSVLVAQPRIAGGWVLQSLGSDLSKYMLIALPFALLPMWLAISQGLRPLRQLSGRIASRSPDDLTPVGVEPGYAEFAPLITALDGLLLQLRRKITAEQAFVANAAHELRTPLAVISAQAHVLGRARSEQQRAEAERYLSAAITRASHLVHQLLVLARLEMAHSAQPLAAADIARVVREDVGQFVPAAMARNMEISLDAPESLMAALDLHALRSVLQNLIDNAIRYACDHGRIVVELSLFGLKRDLIILAVSDDGPGIAECDRSRVFDRFYRGRQQDARGAGLGLTIVKQAAARMGGAVQIMTGLDGRGCRFELRIPAAVAAS